MKDAVLRKKFLQYFVILFSFQQGIVQSSQPQPIRHLATSDTSPYSNPQIVGSQEQLDHFVGQYAGNLFS